MQKLSINLICQTAQNGQTEKHYPQVITSQTEKLYQTGRKYQTGIFYPAVKTLSNRTELSRRGKLSTDILIIRL